MELAHGKNINRSTVISIKSCNFFFTLLIEQVENLDTVSIGVATRWFISPGHQYQNSVHSTMQFFSTYMWKTYYSRMLNKERNVTSHPASNTPPMDERLNFGKKDAAVNFVPKIFPESYYRTQGKGYFVAQEE
jgi:hypothetical protein